MNLLANSFHRKIFAHSRSEFRSWDFKVLLCNLALLLGALGSISPLSFFLAILNSYFDLYYKQNSIELGEIPLKPLAPDFKNRGKIKSSNIDLTANLLAKSSQRENFCRENHSKPETDFGDFAAN